MANIVDANPNENGLSILVTRTTALLEPKHIPDASDPSNIGWKNGGCTDTAMQIVTVPDAKFTPYCPVLAKCEAQQMLSTFVQEQLQLKLSVSPKAAQPALDIAAKFHGYCHVHFCEWLRLLMTFRFEPTK
jgi:hypothetical protein